MNMDVESGWVCLQIFTFYKIFTQCCTKSKICFKINLLKVQFDSSRSFQKLALKQMLIPFLCSKMIYTDKGGVHLLLLLVVIHIIHEKLLQKGILLHFQVQTWPKWQLQSLT